MIAFVLSGAGNRGPLEVGALQALHEHGIKPDFLVGTSAGAMNSMYVAAHGLEANTTKDLADFWGEATAHTIYPGNIVQVAWRFVTGANSLYPSDGMRAMLQKALPAGVRNFGDCKIPLFVTAGDLQTARLFLFGEDPNVSLVEATLASASVPSIHPPVSYAGLQLVDGGTVANVAASVAMNKGADEIYVINASWGGNKLPPAKGVLSVLSLTLNTLLAQSFLRDMDEARMNPNITLHNVYVGAFHDLSFRDFSKTAEMVVVGKEKADAYLANPIPETFSPSAAPRFGAQATPTYPVMVGGARDITPDYPR